MKRKIYKLLSSAKEALFALVLTVFSGTAYSQTTYTFNYTGSIQTLTLQPGTFDIKMWGANGGNSGSTRAGIGGYSNGTLTLLSTTTLYIVVGGTPIYTNATGLQPGGYNGGGTGYANASGRAGGGATHIATTTGTLGALVSNTSAVIIVAGGGGGDQNAGLIGHGGGLSGGGTYPGTQTGSAGGIFGAFGEGGNITVSYGGGGGGGWYGGGGNQNNAGSGGSGYIGGVSNAVTTMSGQIGYVPNPAVTGDGRVLITELCSVQIYASGSNSINPSICSGNSLTLTTTAVSNYTWSNGNTTNTMIVVSPTSSQTYSVIGTSTAACQAAGLISVTVNSVLPVLTITNTPNNICLGKAATLTAGGAVSYTWTGGAGINNGVSFVPPGGINNYTVTGQNGCGISTAVTALTVAPLAITIVASSTVVCAGSTTTLTANSAVTGYTWQPTGPITNSVAIFGPVVNTVYTVTASDGTCSGVASIAIQAKPIPTLSIVSSATAVCQGAPVTMTASGALTYSWTPGIQSGASNSDNPTGPTLYVVTGTNALGCSASTSTFVLTNASPTPVINANKTIVCAGDQVILTASGASSYVWTGGPPTPGYNVNPQVTTDYVVTGTGNGCSGSTTITINVLTASVSISSSTTSICNGGSVNLSASGANTYTWAGSQISGFGANVTVMPNVTSIYTISATTTTLTAPTLKCPSSANITITVFNNPTVTIAATNTQICKQDAAIILTGVGATTYTWNNNATTNTISVHPQSTIVYNITGMDINGCMNTGNLQVKVNTCTGITALNALQSSVSVYPNPNNGTFMLKSDAAMDLILVNELGQHLRSFKLQESANFSVEIKDLKPGIYFIVNEKGSGAAVQKIVVN